ncbi:MAG: helix-turn-helix domain-containing protein [Alphaproteobacteria bacterium]
MINKQKKHSKILDMVEEDLFAIGEIKDSSLSINKFNKIRYLQPKNYSANAVTKIRKKLNISQPTFAFLLNASESTVKKWETGAKKPGGANCRLLQIIENNGATIFEEK